MDVFVGILATFIRKLPLDDFNFLCEGGNLLLAREEVRRPKDWGKMIRMKKI